MGLFSKKDDYNRMFSRNERVVAAYDLPGVPERTGGKVKMVNGFEWQRCFGRPRGWLGGWLGG